MKIILASKSGVRKQILDKYKIDNEVMVSNVDEDEIKESLLAEGADPLIRRLCQNGPSILKPRGCL